MQTRHVVSYIRAYIIYTSFDVAFQDIRIAHQTSLMEVAEKGLYWTRAFIRQHYRRHAAHAASQGYVRATLEGA